MTELRAWRLTWADVDPNTHPFDLDTHAADELAALVATLLPGPEFIHSQRWDWSKVVTAFLAERYGPWTCGWNWTLGEGDLDGGVIGVWSVPGRFVPAEETAPAVVAALLEWRDWLEELAERFAALAPPEGEPVAKVDPWYWERACTRLVTVVADRSEAQSGWYGHCAQVLEWFLTSHGMDTERASRVVDTAIGGRFRSWAAPGLLVVDAVSTRFAEALSEDE